jgi:CheY-like chemotaxis protein
MPTDFRLIAVTGLHRSQQLYAELRGVVHRLRPNVLALVGDFLDVVFIGWRILGVVSGAKFLEWCRQSPVCASLAVVVLSGTGVEADIDEAMRLGANLAIAKPTSIQALTDRLTEICNSAAAKKRQAGY